MALSSIDRFTFLTMSRLPALVRQTYATRSRPGLSGTSVQQLGIRSNSFQVQTFVDVLNQPAGLVLAEQYRRLTGAQQAVRVVWEGANLLSVDHRFFVLDVEPVPGFPRAILYMRGGTVPGARAVLRANWTLQPVNY